MKVGIESRVETEHKTEKNYLFPYCGLTPLLPSTDLDSDIEQTVKLRGIIEHSYSVPMQRSRTN